MAEATKRYVVGVFDDEEVLLHAVEDIRAKGLKIMEVFTPFPVHGLDVALGYKRSKIDRIAFLFGCTGFVSAISMITYMMHIDWPMNIGGKSSLPLPDFVPVTFELSVLFTAFGMVITFLVGSGLLPGIIPKMFDPRSTDDKFVMVMEQEKNPGKSEEELGEAMKSHGASEWTVKEM